MLFKNKRILISAGPTWVPIDKVRVISNIATAKTGIILANKANRLGAKVTLVLGPVGEVSVNKKINIKRYRFFKELHNLIKKELSAKRYDIVMHSAAVSDYRPKRIFNSKIKSGVNNLRLDLEPTPKIADIIKKCSPYVLLVIFKLEIGASQEEMLKNARKAMQSAGADLCVANTFFKDKYKALIIDRDKILCRADSKEKLTTKLLDVISGRLGWKSE